MNFWKSICELSVNLGMFLKSPCEVVFFLNLVCHSVIFVNENDSKNDCLFVHENYN